MTARRTILASAALVGAAALAWWGTRESRADDTARRAAEPELPSPEPRAPDASVAAPRSSPFEHLELDWPFGAKVDAFVYQTYGQAQGDATEQDVEVHGGLDLACPPRTEVFAPLAGVVVSLEAGGVDPVYDGLTLKSDDDVPLYLQLLHVDSATMPYGLGDRVEVGDYLGDVAEYPNGAFETHLHLALIAPPFVELHEGGAGVAPVNRILAVRNPLPHLRRPEDAVPPTILELGEHGVFRFHEVIWNGSGYLRRTVRELDPRSLGPAAPLVDVEFCVYDVCPGNLLNRVTPYRATLRVERVSDGALVLERGLLMDGPLNLSADPNTGTFTDGTVAPGQSARYVLHLLTMCPLVDGNPDRALCDPQQPGPLDVGDVSRRFGAGDYDVRVRVEDHDGGADERMMRITLDDR